MSEAILSSPPDSQPEWLHDATPAVTALISDDETTFISRFQVSF